jgi:hypothetical protein
MLTAILGFLVSVMYVRKLSVTWAFAFGLVFFLMIIAALISMIEAPVRGQLMPKLEKETREKDYVLEAIKKKYKKKPKKRKKASKKKR